MKKGFYIIIFSCLLLLQINVVKQGYTINFQQTSIDQATIIEDQNNALSLINFDEYSIISSGFESLGTTTPQQLTFYKNSLGGLFLIGCNELFFASQFNQVYLKATNQLIRYRKKDLIFPFHYFT